MSIYSMNIHFLENKAPYCAWEHRLCHQTAWTPVLALFVAFTSVSLCLGFRIFRKQTGFMRHGIALFPGSEVLSVWFCFLLSASAFFPPIISCYWCLFDFHLDFLPPAPPPNQFKCSLKYVHRLELCSPTIHKALGSISSMAHNKCHNICLYSCTQRWRQENH